MRNNDEEGNVPLWAGRIAIAVCGILIGVIYTNLTSRSNLIEQTMLELKTQSALLGQQQENDQKRNDALIADIKKQLDAFSAQITARMDGLAANQQRLEISIIGGKPGKADGPR